MLGKIRKWVKSDAHYCLVLFSISFVFFSFFISPTVGGDSLSMYIPAKQLISENNLNMWDGFNDLYNTYYFKMPFTDEAIVHSGESYPIQNLPTIFIYALPMIFFGDNGFFYANPFMAAFIVAIVYLISRELGFSKPLSTVPSIVLATMPVFIEWAVYPQNIIPSTLFFCLSLLMLLKASRYDYNGYYFLSGMFLALSIFSRTPHALLLLAFVPYFVQGKKWPYFKWDKICYFMMSMVLILVIVGVGNWYYFGDPLYQGYLQATYHPDPLNLPNPLIPSGSETFLGFSFDVGLLVQSFVDFIEGSTIIYFPLLLISIGGIMVINREHRRLQIFCLITLVTMLGYYSQISPILYSENGALKYSLPVTFYRYLLPAYVIMVLGVPFIILFISKTFARDSIDTRKKIMAVLIVGLMMSAMASASLAYNYQGGASLRWHNEISSKMADYSEQFDGKLIKGSVILYDSRWGLQMAYQSLNAYHWFYYDGIPPSSRYLHTNQIVEEMLNDGIIVYFLHFDQPYDDLSKDMEASLLTNYTFVPIPSTNFPRMHAIYYQLLPAETEI